MTDVVNIGAAPNDSNGDLLRNGFQKINAEFASIKASLNNRGAWATGTVYAVLDTFTNAGQSYVVSVAHTAGVFATDLAANKFGLNDVLSFEAKLANFSDDFKGS